MLKQILIIDDSEEIQDLVKYCVARSWPKATINLYNPEQGIPDETFNWQDYDLLILDYQLNLPDQNGFDWLKILKQYQGVPPILFMTSYGDEKVAVRSIKLGANDYLNKEELTPKNFTECVEEILREQEQNTGEIHRQENIIDNEKTVHLTAEETLSAMTLTSQKNVKIESKKQTDLPVQDTKKDMDRSLLFEPDAESTLTGEGISGHSTDSSDIPIDRNNIVVPGYCNLRKIGEGGMASVFLAERVEDQLEVILKVLYIVDSEDRNALRRFIREFRMIADLDHPNVARVHERAFASHFAYIAMEYCPAGDLSARLDKVLPTETTIKYMQQIAAGLSAAHKLGIIHRDIKPGNILFREDDSIAITDFGIAKTLGAESELTVVGSMVGTLLYISPEQISGKKVDKYSDLYSLGVIFYRMLTGEYPFYGNSVDQILTAHLTTPPPKLPQELASFQPIIDGLLAKDPDERFQSAEEFIVGLQWN